MKKVVATIMVRKHERPLFSTEPMSTYRCEEVYEELCDKFRLREYDIKIIKTTTYVGYAKLENIKKEEGL